MGVEYSEEGQWGQKGRGTLRKAGVGAGKGWGGHQRRARVGDRVRLGH